MKLLNAILLAFLAFLSWWIYCIWVTPDYSTNLKEGDVIFCTGLNPIALYTTKSPITHCGIIVDTPKGMAVLEARNGVEMTSLYDFCNRGWLPRRIWVKTCPKTIKVKTQKYLGKNYDGQFKLGNDKWYCSELVYDIYKENGITLCEPRPLCTLNIRYLGEQLKKRNISPEQRVVSPIDVFNSTELQQWKYRNIYDD